MTTHTDKLCDRCHERPATCHICYGHTGETKDLCETCYRDSASPEELASSQQIQDSIRNGKCKYCGEPAVGGCGGFMPMLGEQLDLWCEQCRQDLVEFGSRPENAIPDFPFDDEAAQALVSQQLAEYKSRKEEFMKRKISARRSQG